jgi:hypothetical protein
LSEPVKRAGYCHSFAASASANRPNGRKNFPYPARQCFAGSALCIMTGTMNDKRDADSDKHDMGGKTDSELAAPKGNISLKIQAAKRAERLRAELRANLARRKLQARARREGAEDDRPGNLLSDDDPARSD